jgi:hypothetical protein
MNKCYLISNFSLTRFILYMNGLVPKSCVFKIRKAIDYLILTSENNMNIWIYRSLTLSFAYFSWSSYLDFFGGRYQKEIV